jgi:hypothetical protein
VTRALGLAAVVAAALVALTLPGAALATNECNGLDVCISVPGPWVTVPGSPAGRLVTVEYQLSCPRGSIAGGLGAVGSDDALAVRFLGSLGSPVNPGISTGRAVVFVAWWARRTPTSFRPLLGCIPTSGGGGRSTTATGPAKGRPPLRLVRSLRVAADGLSRLRVACRAGERLVGSSHAVTFPGRRAPAAAAVSGVSVSRVERGNAVLLRARRGAAVPRAARVVVQLHAICARGSA